LLSLLWPLGHTILLIPSVPLSFPFCSFPGSLPSTLRPSSL
jgi:hypothetical protein